MNGMRTVSTEPILDPRNAARRKCRGREDAPTQPATTITAPGRLPDMAHSESPRQFRRNP